MHKSVLLFFLLFNYTHLHDLPCEWYEDEQFEQYKQNIRLFALSGDLSYPAGE